jgi:hypothetical protein
MSELAPRPHPNSDSPQSPYGFLPKSMTKMCQVADVGDYFLVHH